jgi:hypothetical protein
VRSRPALDFTRPAVVQVGKFGDQLLALPALRALGAIFPSGMQLLLGEGMYSFFYRGLPLNEAVRVWWKDYAKGTIDAARTARYAAPCDLMLCFSQLPFVEELSQTMGASWSVGYCEGFDAYLRIDESMVHAFDKLFSIPQYLDPSLQFARFCDPPLFSPAAESAAARYVAAVRASGQRLLFVHPETIPEKEWSHERFAWVLGQFLAERPEYKVIVSSISPIDFGVYPKRVMVCDAHLEFAFAVMRHVDLFLGVDSCFLHAADLFRVPGVALFGPSDSRHWGFRLSPKFSHVVAESMDKIRPEPVLDALLEFADG